jgi:ABC-2 type transport system ATP-binding protein
MAHTAVAIRDVSKRFRIYHERAYTLKERLVSFRRTTYEEFWALKDVSFEIDASQTAGLIGPNGSGKSTLLKMVAGIIRPTSGEIATRGRIASLLELGAGFHPDLTGRENIFMNASILGLTRKQTTRFFDAIVDFAGLERFIDTQVRHYSSGMYVRLGFAVAVHVDPEILIVDEVLAVGDEAFQRKCLSRIRDFQRDGRTIVFVTHAVDQIREICTQAFFLAKGQVAHAGRPSDVVDAYRRYIHGGEKPASGSYEERGTREVAIVDVRFIDDRGEERQVFSPGEAIEVRTHLHADKPVEDPVVGMQVFDETGRYLWGTNTAMRDMSLGTVNGDMVIRWRIPALPVLDGTCLVTVAVTSRVGGHEYHWREKGWAFKVVNVTPDLGASHFDVRIDVDR